MSSFLGPHAELPAEPLRRTGIPTPVTCAGSRPTSVAAGHAPGRRDARTLGASTSHPPAHAGQGPRSEARHGPRPVLRSPARSRPRSTTRPSAARRRAVPAPAGPSLPLRDAARGPHPGLRRLGRRGVVPGLRRDAGADHGRARRGPRRADGLPDPQHLTGQCRSRRGRGCGDASSAGRRRSRATSRPSPRARPAAATSTPRSTSRAPASRGLHVTSGARGRAPRRGRGRPRAARRPTSPGWPRPDVLRRTTRRRYWAGAQPRAQPTSTAAQVGASRTTAPTTSSRRRAAARGRAYHDGLGTLPGTHVRDRRAPSSVAPSGDGRRSRRAARARAHALASQPTPRWLEGAVGAALGTWRVPTLVLAPPRPVDVERAEPLHRVAGRRAHRARRARGRRGRPAARRRARARPARAAHLAAHARDPHRRAGPRRGRTAAGCPCGAAGG